MLEVVAYTDYMLPNTTYLKNITICINSPVNLPLKGTENELLLCTR